MKNITRRIINKIDRIVIPIFSKSKFLTEIYYLLFTNAFRREHNSVLAGKAKYLNDIKESSTSFYMLTRNIHRIEKGLLMKPRRKIFAKSYIKETLDGFEKVYNQDDHIDNGQVQWFHDVLAEYFKVCEGSDGSIDLLNERFKSLTENVKNGASSDRQLIPYRRNDINKIKFEDFYKLCKHRRSVRWFQNKKVPRNLIDEAISAASLSPSACNRQPFEYIVIDDNELLKEVVNIPLGTSGYADNIPVMIICVGNLDAYYSERDRHLIYIDGSLANMTLMFALETLGLSSCSINWPDIEEKEKRMKAVLELEDYQRPIMCLAVGYPDPNGKVAFSKKKDLKTLRRYN